MLRWWKLKAESALDALARRRTRVVLGFIPPCPTICPIEGPLFPVRLPHSVCLPRSSSRPAVRSRRGRFAPPTAHAYLSMSMQDVVLTDVAVGLLESGGSMFLLDYRAAPSLAHIHLRALTFSILAMGGCTALHSIASARGGRRLAPPRRSRYSSTPALRATATVSLRLYLLAISCNSHVYL
ncbi:hypothetical protein PENSPDRAFT_659346 [Peniophora sp. CONT]|nr:hypothetical protein PENSPDRAFT_659346 [Peniophora sp. CONT]